MNIETIKALCPEFAATALRTSRVKERVRRFDAVDGLFFLSGTKDRSMVAKSWSREDAELFAVAEDMLQALAEARQAMEWRPISEYDGESLAVFCLQVINAGNEQKQWDVLVGMPDASGQVVAVDGDDLGWGLEDVEFFKYITFPTPPSGKEG